MKISTKLLEKYNTSVPRYTSYPPANYFVNEFKEEVYRQMIVESNSKTPQNISFYIHIPFCKKICFYCGCNACALGKGLQVQPYFEALKKEIEMLCDVLDTSRKVSQIHYGGGTPNAIPTWMLKDINQMLFNRFDFIDNAEIAIECNPAYLDKDDINQLLDAGFNRFSLGIQDFENKVLENVNREPSLLPVGELIKQLKSGEKAVSVNLDFIYGLPGQTLKSFTETITKAIELQPDRLVTFSYAHVPWIKKHQKVLEKKGLPSADEKMQMFLAAYDLLKDAGYVPVGFDHFVRPEDELNLALENKQLHRNFQGYCTRRTTGQVYAIGVSGISQLAQGYIQSGKEIDPYIASISAGKFAVEKGLQLTNEQQLIKEIINELMCNKHINWEFFANRQGVSIASLLDEINYDPSQIEDFENDGLLIVFDHGFTVTEKGTHFIRNIAAALDPAFKEHAFNYSKSV